MLNEKLQKILSTKLTTAEPLLILIQGIPGSGKTTLAKELSHFFGIPYFEADQYFEDSSGNYLFDPADLHSAHQNCYHNVGSQLLKGHSCICSNTFVRDKDLSLYYTITPNIFLIRMTTSFGSIHNVPEETLTRMKKRLASSLAKPDFVI